MILGFPEFQEIPLLGLLCLWQFFFYFKPVHMGVILITSDDEKVFVGDKASSYGVILKVECTSTIATTTTWKFGIILEN